MTRNVPGFNMGTRLEIYNEKMLTVIAIAKVWWMHKLSG
jgi:hypothetical protein